jgi:hypothetical protein
MTPLAMPAIAVLGATFMAGVAHAQHGAPIGGIHHFEVVVLGEDVPCGDDHNVAYEVTDCGLVVGQRARQLAGGACSSSAPSLRRIAFVYAVTAQFGIPAGTLAELPNPDPAYGGFSAAFDVNESGVVVGSVGAERPTSDYLSQERSAVWRLLAGSSPTLAVVGPPTDAAFRSYGQGGFGRLESVSSTGISGIWAVGHFRINGSCGIGFGSPKYAATTVRIDSLPSQDYRWEIDAEGGGGSVRAVSRDATRLAGSRVSCPSGSSCGGLPEEARAWAFDVAPTTLVGSDRNPDVFPGNDWKHAKIEAILPDGSAAGQAWDSPLDGSNCQMAYAWQPGNLSAGTPLLDVLTHPDAGKGFAANDMESLDAQISSGRIVVGRVNSPADDPGGMGAIWFRPNSAAGWTTQDWEYRRVSSMASPRKSATETVRVVNLEGVNRYGDCVGSADVARLDPDGGLPQKTRRAVLLRAVPTACVGDLNRDGVIGPQDLAVLLSYWCGAQDCSSAAAIADLNVDGAVGAQDLSIFLANWGGSCSWPQCSALAGDVPLESVRLAMESVEFASGFVGLGDFAGYRAWRGTVPAPLAEIVDGVLWDLAKGGS